MALDFIFKQDIRRAIRALYTVAQTYSGDYQRGYLAALMALALIFGIDESD